MAGTESQDLRFTDIDLWPTADAVNAMLDGQLAAVNAVRSQASCISAAADAAADRLGEHGRLIYVGAGTSGRIAVLDGTELGPTFGWSPRRLVYLMAGGMQALAQSAEGAEDDARQAESAIANHAIAPDDVVIGVAASGRTPFTLAAVKCARSAGALTIAVVNNSGSALTVAAQYAIAADTGSEIIAGSTRMKAGTAQKIILNTLSTAIMLRLGRVYRGMMVDMVISNEKLFGRAVAMVQSLTDCPQGVAADALESANRDIKTAVLIALGMPLASAATLLAEHRGVLRDALQTVDRSRFSARHIVQYDPPS
jgi:N-acetylmuramic acid 6-phosphate etherase